MKEIFFENFRIIIMPIPIFWKLSDRFENFGNTRFDAVRSREEEHAHCGPGSAERADVEVVCGDPSTSDDAASRGGIKSLFISIETFFQFIGPKYFGRLITSQRRSTHFPSTTQPTTYHRPTTYYYPASWVLCQPWIQQVLPQVLEPDRLDTSRILRMPSMR